MLRCARVSGGVRRWGTGRHVPVPARTWHQRKTGPFSTLQQHDSLTMRVRSNRKSPWMGARSSIMQPCAWAAGQGTVRVLFNCAERSKWGK